MRGLTAKVDGEDRLILGFPAPTQPLSINKARGRHWAASKRLLDPWNHMALVAMRQGLARAWVTEQRGGRWHDGVRTPVSIQVELPFRTAAARRDPHNYTGTNVKAVVDGLVRGGLVPDDGPEWVTVVDPALIIQRDKSEPLMARVIITPRSLT